MDTSFSPLNRALGKELSQQDSFYRWTNIENNRQINGSSSTPYKTSNHTHSARSFWQALKANPKRHIRIKKIRNIPNELLSVRALTYRSYPTERERNAHSPLHPGTLEEIASRRNSQPGRLSKFADYNNAGNKSSMNLVSLILHERSSPFWSPKGSKNRVASFGVELTLSKTRSELQLGSCFDSANPVYIFQANRNIIL